MLLGNSLILSGFVFKNKTVCFTVLFLKTKPERILKILFQKHKTLLCFLPNAPFWSGPPLGSVQTPATLPSNASPRFFPWPHIVSLDGCADHYSAEYSRGSLHISGVVCWFFSLSDTLSLNPSCLFLQYSHLQPFHSRNPPRSPWVPFLHRGLGTLTQ